MVRLEQFPKPLKELLVENSILFRSLRLALFELSQRICLWAIKLALVVARYDLALEFEGCILRSDYLDLNVNVESFFMTLFFLILILGGNELIGAMDDFLRVLFGVLNGISYSIISLISSIFVQKILNVVNNGMLHSKYNQFQ